MASNRACDKLPLGFASSIDQSYWEVFQGLTKEFRKATNHLLATHRATDWHASRTRYGLWLPFLHRLNLSIAQVQGLPLVYATVGKTGFRIASLGHPVESAWITSVDEAAFAFAAASRHAPDFEAVPCALSVRFVESPAVVPLIDVDPMSQAWKRVDHIYVKWSLFIAELTLERIQRKLVDSGFERIGNRSEPELSVDDFTIPSDYSITKSSCEFPKPSVALTDIAKSTVSGATLATAKTCTIGGHDTGDSTFLSTSLGNDGGWEVALPTAEDRTASSPGTSSRPDDPLAMSFPDPSTRSTVSHSPRVTF